MYVLCTGLNYRGVPVEVRESIAYSGERLASALAEVSSLHGIDQVVVLSTCNRTEIYTASPEEAAAEVRRWLISRAESSREVLVSRVYQLTGFDAAKHLCHVAAGLDSQVIGESEILGQVKGAMNVAREAETLGPELEKMFMTSVRAGKRARSETAIGRGAFSVGRCAVDTAKATLGSLEGRAVLILGAGKTAENTVRHLLSQGADTVLVANRTFSRAQELARELGGRAIRYDQLTQGLVEADIAITATSAPHFVLMPEHVEEAMTRRNGAGLFLIDIAVPRDIDPRVAAIPGVHLCDIDHLSDGVRSAQECRSEEVEVATEIACECAREFSRWLCAREAVPALTALWSRFEEVRQDQLSRFAARIQRLSSADRELLELVTRSIVKRLLHEPTVNLKHELAVGNGKAADLLVCLHGLSPSPHEGGALPAQDDAEE